MRIVLKDLGKKFNKEWIFRNVNQTFYAGESYALLGTNGSGKSTLLQAISGFYQLSEGAVLFFDADKEIPAESHYQYTVLCSPGLELIEEFTLKEFLNFHFSLKNYFPGTGYHDIIEQTGLKNAEHRQIKLFSSGMKQRIKLAISFFSDSPLLLLDEPCTNLDISGIAWYQQLINKYTQNRIVIVASNQEIEYSFCNNILQMITFK